VTTFAAPRRARFEVVPGQRRRSVTVAATDNDRVQ